MKPLRWLPGSICSAALLLSPSARGDVSSPGERIVPSEAVFTGLRDFPAYRFVVAVVPFSGSSWSPGLGAPPPSPSAVGEGEPVSTDTTYFQELRAIPVGTLEPVTDAWLASSRAPSSGSFSRHPHRVPIASDERMVRARYRVRQIQAGWVSLELGSAVALRADGSERVLSKTIPRGYSIASITSPPGWGVFLMPDPAWPRADLPLPVVRCEVGEALPLSPGPRTLVAVQGEPGPGGSLEGKTFFAWGRPLDAWERLEVGVDSAAVAARRNIMVEIDPGNARPLQMSLGESYQDAEGRWFDDEDARRLPIEASVRWGRWAAGGGLAAALMAAGLWALRRRRR